METIKIFILKEDVDLAINGSRPSKFWYFRPNEYNKEDVVEMNVSTQRIKEWSAGSKGGKHILFG